MRLCSIDNCNRIYKAKGMCMYHYNRSDDVKQRDRQRYQNNIEYQRQRSRIKNKKTQKYHTKYTMDRNTRFVKLLNITYTQFVYQLQQLKKKVKTRDDNTCQTCGGSPDIVHHIIHRQYYPKLTLNENNMITLCKDCHKQVHGRWI